MVRFTADVFLAGILALLVVLAGCSSSTAWRLRANDKQLGIGLDLQVGTPAGTPFNVSPTGPTTTFTPTTAPTTGATTAPVTPGP